MSYSDYGAFAWKNGVRFTAAEDATLIGITAPAERPLEAATGLKLDVLVNAYAQQGKSYGAGESEEVNWMTGHPHHVVLGGMKGLALVGHKQSVSVLIDGKKISEFPGDIGDARTNQEREAMMNAFYDRWPMSLIRVTGKRLSCLSHRRRIYIKKRWQTKAKVAEHYYDPYPMAQTSLGMHDGCFYALQAVAYPHSYGVLMLLMLPTGEVYSAVTGYGIGEHWWKDEEGREFLKPGDRFTPCLDKKGKVLFEAWSWSTKAEKEDKAKYGDVDTIGPKPGVKWRTDKEWEAFVADWVPRSIQLKSDWEKGDVR